MVLLYEEAGPAEKGPITVITATGEDNERRNANTHPPTLVPAVQRWRSRRRRRRGALFTHEAMPETAARAPAAAAATNGDGWGKKKKKKVAPQTATYYKQGNQRKARGCAVLCSR